MPSKTALNEFKARRKNLVDLALKKQEVPPPKKSAVSFADDAQPNATTTEADTPTAVTVNELPPLETEIPVASPTHVVVNELPPVTAPAVPASAPPIFSLSPIL